MRLANNISVKVFVKGNEDYDKLFSVFLSLFPYDLAEEKIEIEKANATGFNEKKIRILKVFLEKERHTKQFLVNLCEKLSKKSKELLLRQIETRLDENLKFFIRFDKEKLLNREYFITDSGNCFHISINIAAFPRKKEKAIEVLNKLFE